MAKHTVQASFQEGLAVVGRNHDGAERPHGSIAAGKAGQRGFRAYSRPCRILSHFSFRVRGEALTTPPDRPFWVRGGAGSTPPDPPFARGGKGKRPIFPLAKGGGGVGQRRDQRPLSRLAKVSSKRCSLAEPLPVWQL